MLAKQDFRTSSYLFVPLDKAFDDASSQKVSWLGDMKSEVDTVHVMAVNASDAAGIPDAVSADLEGVEQAIEAGGTPEAIQSLEAQQASLKQMLNDMAQGSAMLHTAPEQLLEETQRKIGSYNGIHTDLSADNVIYTSGLSYYEEHGM